MLQAIKATALGIMPPALPLPDIHPAPAARATNCLPELEVQRSIYSAPRLGLQQHLGIRRDRLVDTFTPWELAAAVGEPPARVRSRSEPAVMLTIRSLQPDSVLRVPPPRPVSARCPQGNTNGFAPFTPLPRLQRRGYCSAARWRSIAPVALEEQPEPTACTAEAGRARHMRPHSADAAAAGAGHGSVVFLGLHSADARRPPVAAAGTRSAVATPQKGVPNRCDQRQSRQS